MSNVSSWWGAVTDVVQQTHILSWPWPWPWHQNRSLQNLVSNLSLVLSLYQRKPTFFSLRESEKRDALGTSSFCDKQDVRRATTLKNRLAWKEIGNQKWWEDLTREGEGSTQGRLGNIFMNCDITQSLQSGDVTYVVLWKKRYCHPGYVTYV